MLELSWLRQEIALRSNKLPDDELAAHWLQSAMRQNVGRRQLLKVGVAGSSLAPSAALALARKSLAIKQEGKVVTLRSPSGRCWTIDPDRFDGNAKVNWSRTPDAFVLSLADAALPGTGLRCDFTLTAQLRRANWSGSFAFPVWSARATVSLDDWLDGTTKALAYVHLPESRGGCAGLSSWLHGPATMAFSSEWIFAFEGERIARLEGGGRLASSSSVTFALPAADSRLLINEATSRRTRAVFSGADLTALQPDVGALSLSCPASSEMLVEFARASDHRILVASLWSEDTEQASLNIHLDGAPAHPYQLQLDSYRLAQLHDGDRSSTALFAGVRRGEQWTDGNGISVAVVAGDNAVISASDQKGQTEPRSCEAANIDAARFVIPFVGADTACFTRRARLGERAAQATEFKSHFSFFRGEPIDLDDYALNVSRTTDGFAAVFRFRNIVLVSRLGKWCLAKGTSPEACVLEFELASQHLQEEAIFSASRPGTSTASTELLCGPFAGPQARFVAYVAMRAFQAWRPPKGPVDREIRVLLRNLLESLPTTGLDGPFIYYLRGKLAASQGEDYIPPGGLATYLTQEYAGMLTKAAESDVAGSAAIQKAADVALPKNAFATFRPKAIDAQPTRLLFKVLFDPGAEVPCHLDTLMAWSSGDGKAPRGGVRFEELLSKRAVPSDLGLEQQKALQQFNGDPIFGLHEGRRGADARKSEPSTAIDQTTALEMPYRLTVSPVMRGTAEQAHTKTLWEAVDPPSDVWGRSVSLWHVRAGRSGGAPLPMRALSSPDFKKAEFFNPQPPGGSAIRTSLDGHDRHNLVALSGGFGEHALLGRASVVLEKTPLASGERQLGVFVPQPFFARQLVLTPLGASFDFLGTWDPPGTANGALTVTKWDHRARLRRDTEVTVEYRGYLLPLGIPAVFIKRTTREFKRTGDGPRESYRAVLVQRYSIRVDQRTKEFPALYQPFESRDWCFRNITVSPPETPPLLDPDITSDGSIGTLRHGRQAFWPTVPKTSVEQSCTTGNLFEFQVEDGERSFKVPLVFVDNQVAHTPDKLKDVLKGYSEAVAKRRWEMVKKAEEPIVVRALKRDEKQEEVQKALARMVRGDVEFLPGAGSRNSRHVTTHFALGVQLSNPPKFELDGDPSSAAIDGANLVFDKERERLRQPPFYPRVSQALIESHLLAQLSGNALKRNNIAYHPIYVQLAFNQVDNKGGVFARFVQKGALLDFSGNTSSAGGAMSPTTVMVALAREHGPIGGKTVFELSDPAKPLISAAIKSASADDGVARFMAGVADPLEYFSQSLGDAKLLGCVRLVDIIKTALHVTGTRIPRINQQEIFDGVIDLLRPVLRDVSNGPVSALRRVESELAGNDAPPAVRARLLPPLRAAIASLEQARTEVDRTVPRADVLASLVGAAYGQLRTLANDARQLTENPVALLPAPVQQVIAQAQNAYNLLVLVRDAIENFPDALRARFVEALAEETQTLRNRVEASADYRAIAEWVTRIQDETEALGRAISDSAWQRIGQALGALVVPLADLRGWIGIERMNIEQTLLDFTNELFGWSDDVGKTILPRLQTILKWLEPVEAKLREAHINAPTSDIANAAKEALRSTHQFREIVVTFMGFTARVAEARLELIARLQLASEYMQQLELVLRKFGEVLTLCEQASLKASPVIASQSTAAPDPVANLLTSISDFVKSLRLSAALTGIKDKIKLPTKGLQESMTSALDKAIVVAKLIEGSPNQLRVELTSRKAAIFESVDKQLSLLLARLAPGATQIVQAVAAWQDQLAAIEKRLFESLRQPLSACSEMELPQFVDLENGPLSRELVTRLNKLVADLKNLQHLCKRASADNVLGTINKVSHIADEVRSLVAYVGEAVRGGNLGALVDQRALIEKALSAIGVPTRVRVSYDWDTDIEEFPRGAGAVFRPLLGQGSGPGKQPRFSIHSVSEIDLRKPGPPTSFVEGSIDAFELHLFGSAPFLIVSLKPVKFSAGNGRDIKFDVRVGEIKFGKALNFVNDLAKFIQAESGFYLQAASGVPGVEIGYRFNKDVVQLAALTLQNVSLSLAVVLPFDNSPMRIRVGVGSRQKPVLASVGIYGGGFFVGMTMRADAMEVLEASMEYGGVTGVDFGGIATGTCKITAGIYISLGVRDEIAGFFNACGALTIARIMKVGASLVVTISKSNSNLTGRAVYSFEFSIGFVHFAYSVGVSYTKGGDKDMDSDAAGQRSKTVEQQRAAVVLLQPTSRATTTDKKDKQAMVEVDYRVDMTEDAAVPGQPTRIYPGLADGTVWSTYWNAFSDLDDPGVEMCVVKGGSKS